MDENTPSEAGPASDRTLVENPHCRVRLEEGVLHCSTRGRFVTMTLFAIGMGLVYVTIVIVGWDLPRGRIHSSSLFAGAGVFLVSVLFQWRCLRRQKEMGRFRIDRSNQSIRKPGLAPVYTFEQITHLRLARDWSAVRRLGDIPPMPYWLFIHFRNGHKIRVATGQRKELRDVLHWMRDAGLPGVEWA